MRQGQSCRVAVCLLSYAQSGSDGLYQATSNKEERLRGCQLPRSHRRQRKAELGGKPGRAAGAGFVTREVVEAGHARFLRTQGGQARITLV